MFQPSVITGPKNGHIAMINDAHTIFEIHAMGNNSNREFYSRKPAEDLAAHHAAYLNAGNVPTSSFIRVL